MIRLLFLFGLGLIAVSLVRALLRRAGPPGSLEPQYQRLEDFTEVLSSDDLAAIAAARSALDRARIPTMVSDGQPARSLAEAPGASRTIMVPSIRLDEARSVVAKRV